MTRTGTNNLHEPNSNGLSFKDKAHQFWEQNSGQTIETETESFGSLQRNANDRDLEEDDFTNFGPDEGEISEEKTEIEDLLNSSMVQILRPAGHCNILGNRKFAGDYKPRFSFSEHKKPVGAGVFRSKGSFLQDLKPKEFSLAKEGKQWNWQAVNFGNVDTNQTDVVIQGDLKARNILVRFEEDQFEENVRAGVFPQKQVSLETRRNSEEFKAGEIPGPGCAFIENPLLKTKQAEEEEDREELQQIMDLLGPGKLLPFESKNRPRSYSDSRFLQNEHATNPLLMNYQKPEDSFSGWNSKSYNNPNQKISYTPRFQNVEERRKICRHSSTNSKNLQPSLNRKRSIPNPQMPKNLNPNFETGKRDFEHFCSDSFSLSGNPCLKRVASTRGSSFAEASFGSTFYSCNGRGIKNGRIHNPAPPD